jgi:hypothetical protein
MYSFVRIARRAATPALLGLVLLSCDNDRITASGPRRPLLSHVAVPPPAGSYIIPLPTISDGSPLPEEETGITIPEGDHYVRVRVTGGILLTARADYVSLFGRPEFDGEVVGPRGLMPVYGCVELCPLQVVPRLDGPATGVGFILNDMGNNVGESVVQVTGPGSFTVSRAGLSFGFGCGPVSDPENGPNPCGTYEETLVYAFDFSGEQTLSVDFVALALHASSTTPAAGEIVHFQAEGVNVDLGLSTEWQFRRSGTDEYMPVTACADQLQCDFAPSSDGVMFAQSWVGSGFVGGEVALTLQTAREVRIKPATGALEARPSQTGGTSMLPLQVGVFDTAGVAIPNQTVILALDGIEQTGGHLHGGTMPSGTLTSTVNTGATGIVTVTYAADVFAGQVEIRGTSAGARPAVDTIAVKVGLVELLEQDHVDTTGALPVHRSNHWGTAGMVSALTTLSDSLYRKYRVALSVNDMSLPLGGKFDLSATYGVGGEHAEHRDGRSADVETGGLTRAQINFLRTKWRALSALPAGMAVHDETATRNHFHFRF